MGMLFPAVNLLATSQLPDAGVSSRSKRTDRRIPRLWIVGLAHAKQFANTIRFWSILFLT